MVINVYDRYYRGNCVFNGVERRGVRVLLIADSEAGSIRYEAAVSFFPHRDPEDFAVSYDAYAAAELYSAKGRRSRQREEKLLETLREQADVLAAGLGGSIQWDSPLGEARRG